MLGLFVVSAIYTFGIGALVGKFAPQLAEESMARSAPLLMMFAPEYEPCQGLAALDCGFRDTEGREEVSCAGYADERSAVLMTFGQSNSANAGQDKYIPVGAVANFNIHDNKCYKAEDPLLGPDGQGGSVWGVLADKLIVAGHYDNVLIVPFGIGGSSLEQWQQESRFFPILVKAVGAITEVGISPTHILWHQGETDADIGTSEDEYFDMFSALVEHVRAGGIAAPIYPAIATHCQISLPGREVSVQPGTTSVRRAQERLPVISGVVLGPDTDVIQGSLYRHDNCHFNAKGMQAHAGAWLGALTGSPR